MTDDVQHNQDEEEARRLLSEALSSPEGEGVVRASETFDSWVGLVGSLSAMSALVGWDLDGPSVVRAFTLFWVVMDNPTGRSEEETVAQMRALEGTNHFAALEAAWQRGREAAEGE